MKNRFMTGVLVGAGSAAFVVFGNYEKGFSAGTVY